ncbi:MAG TPA: MBOAT family protein, partial [Candidatus Goldiibacteriota bacterium]|nr:MBOAT family protein [Candidatus Goldiibacteriota bacterium]
MVWKPEYVIIIIIETAVNYWAALAIEKENVAAKKKAYLATAMLVNFGFLFVFKYFNFFNDSVRFFLEQFNIMYNYPQFKLLLPIGISFYTFQIASYTIDVYRKKIEAEKRPGTLAVYLVFFPQLVAGPI